MVQINPSSAVTSRTLLPPAATPPYVPLSTYFVNPRCLALHQLRHTECAYSGAVEKVIQLLQQQLQLRKLVIELVYDPAGGPTGSVELVYQQGEQPEACNTSPKVRLAHAAATLLHASP